MDNVWLASALWLGLALIASIISIWVAISVALIEIVVGAVAGNVVGLPLTEWVNFLAGFGAILLTFLAGTEIDPEVVRRHFRSSMSIGVVGFLAPYLGVLLYRPLRARLAVAAGADRRHLAVHHLGGGRLRGHGRDRLQPDRARQDHPRRLLRERPRHRAGARHRLRPLRPVAGAVRRRDGGGAVAAAALRAMALQAVGHRVSEPETKFVALVLLRLGGLATIAGSEAVLPAYLVGMALAPAFLARPRAAAPHAHHRLHHPDARSTSSRPARSSISTPSSPRPGSSSSSSRSRWLPSLSASCR